MHHFIHHVNGGEYFFFDLIDSAINMPSSCVNARTRNSHATRQKVHSDDQDQILQDARAARDMSADVRDRLMIDPGQFIGRTAYVSFIHMAEKHIIFIVRIVA